MKKCFLLLFTLLFYLHSYAQENEETYVIHIKKAKDAIRLDGVLDEQSWKNAAVADNFFLNKPFDTTYASLQTKAMVLFDDNFLYVAAEVIEPRGNYIISSLKRDFQGGESDVFAINIDPFKDKLNGFQFAVSPLNVQREGIISLGDQADNTWDNKWYSQVKNYDDKWVVEMAIPFKTLRYKVMEGQNSWRVNFGRGSIKTNEISSWKPVPRNFRLVNLAFTGLLIWDDKPPVPGPNVSLIPFISGGISKDFPRNEENLQALATTTNRTAGIGLDAKIAVTPSLNLDITINPDFSQVEVDQQQTNLSRFELFFPERRQFFIENSDLFGTFGFPDTRPFFSRRIGITRHPITGLAKQVPILAGARLSGKLNDDWRIGAMNMQTRKVDFGDDAVLPATNYSVLTLQRKVFERSSFGGIVVNKENLFDGLTSVQKEGHNKYNRVAGLEFNYYSPNNRFETETYVHQSFSPNAAGKGDATNIAHFMGYHHPNIDLNLGVVRIGENYNAETGYVPRTGVWNLYRPLAFILNPKNERISKYITAYGIGMEGNDVFDLKGKRLDSETAIFAFFNTPANSEFNVGYFMGYTYLFDAFDPTNASDNPNPDLSRNVVPLPIGAYKYQAYFVGLKSSTRNNFQVAIDAFAGDYFNGKGIGLESSFSYRVQPYGKISVDVNYNKIELPKPYNQVNYWLIGPKAEVAFSRSLFWSTFFQYNTQTNNTNINTRLQWRFKPVSDLFIVYTDNYFAESINAYKINPWTPKSRALVVKLTYWLNV